MIEVFYIAYLKKDSHWGLPAFNKFLASYEKYEAGIEHKLTILLRGFENNLEDYNKIKEICSSKNINTLDTKDVGLDFGAYLDGAKQSDADYICCLNTSCEIMCEDWLKKLYSPIEQDEKYQMVGACGCVGSCLSSVQDWRSATSKVEKIYIFLKKINLFRYFFKYLFMHYMCNFNNYFIRTSSFLISKKAFEYYFKTYNLPQSKVEAYQIEGGENSISKFVLSKNFDFCVVDKYGTKFNKYNFEKSNTFMTLKKNYIIRDRGHDIYEHSNFLFRIYLKRICWGKFI